ncbi:MAG: MogA/MoaB family molybdenum cofactor biosynthesis protein [Tissierellia bacterium]|nr:MogA/MoaB family molybdenum cofactor biosynthesis protein [Tissierellia bacterium]MDD4725732.1 MogA/MoaB family molybdenum cofactor biosynthesis protein [Tissierellia bacterium]
MYKVGIITASDKGSKGQREDLSGKAINDIVTSKGYKVLRQVIVPDEESELIREMKYMADDLKADLILTTGGTGFSKRDMTPEASMKVFTRQAPGIAEAIRYYSLSITSRAMLSRAVSGIRNDCLIINLPGSPKAVKEALEYAIDSIDHGLGILTGKENECAR